MLLAGDIGGTKTVLAVFTAEGGAKRPVVERVFPSNQYASLTKLLQEFLAEIDYPIEAASFGVAGPVIKRRAEITNLPWVISEAGLSDVLDGAPARLLNDLQAVANSVPVLDAEDVLTLHHAEPVEGGAIAVIAPGTGLGEAYLTWDGSRYLAYASEGGHVDFAPRDSLEIEMLRWLQARMDHVSYEWVCSGKGIPNIYAFLKDSGHAEEPAWLTEQLIGAADPTPIIVNAAQQTDPTCELCSTTLAMFVSILGAEAGNLALKVLATGGVYVGGGIPPRILPELKSDRFMQAFLRKGRFSDELYQMPVHVILNSGAALIGAAQYGLEHLL